MMGNMHIRNFVIIAHIDSGKSTLADRFLELTGTVEPHRMRPQYLDRLPLERERGITIKMAPVRMLYKTQVNAQVEEYVLNLIDTPGHSDFSYEVSRALAAVEGAILLVDGAKGIQAQTLSNLRAVRKAGLEVIGAVNKVDLELPNLSRTVQSVAELLGVKAEEIFSVSAKTGRGVKEILEEVMRVVPPPKAISAGQNAGISRALIFDSLYDDHKGIIAFVRVFDGEFRAGDEVRLLASGAKLKIKEAGYFSPEFSTSDRVLAGEIGYIATGLKEPALVKIGDTVLSRTNAEQQTQNEAESSGPRKSASSPRESASKWALPGYREPAPVVFISFYPDGATKFEDMFKAFGRLRLNDAALSFEPDANEALGRGLKVGFLGQLHFEITASRLRDEFGLEFITSFPSIAYRVQDTQGERLITKAQDFPEHPEKAWQPMIALEILSPSAYVSGVVNLKNAFDIAVGDMEALGDNLVIHARMPLAELIRDFDDRLKSISSGFASFSYERDGEEEAHAERLEVLIAGEVMPELTRVVLRKDIEREARATAERLKKLLPRQQFAQAVQARAGGRIVARETVPAVRKDVTGYLYGGDRTRKMKLWRKQQRGKEKLEKLGRIRLTPAILRDLLKK